MKPKVRQITPVIYEFEWNSIVSDELLQYQLSFKTKIQEAFISEIHELRLGFKTLSIVFRKAFESFILHDWLNSFTPEQTSNQLPEKIWVIPVCYSIETGRDLEVLAKNKNLSQEQVVEVHTGPLYRLHFYGFLPGFMYLNGLSESLYTPRKSIPDRSVPKGSVAIGGSQTGVYPSPSPGGWHLIGQTPISLFNPYQNHPVFASVGERIEFFPITNKEFDRLTRHPQMPASK
ncbi:5-oxoprolinase subunit PxpB [uncultured Algoriphagus sp.]|uniref:5-oxoprolinase subunit PxpB n=1 Tax=uncultured Algoriphagus sp. TaxID=417365 RepID=UPI0030EDA395|tara:strand:+ start:37707 stop:38402 length:696 start_codon:yes stop_codon:yes gene_type:complete